MRSYESHLGQYAVFAVWRPSTASETFIKGDPQWTLGETAPQFLAKDDALFYDSWRMRSFVPYRSNGVNSIPLFGAVWERGGGPQHWVKPMSFYDFADVDVDQFNQGRRVRSLYYEPGKQSLAAMWRQGAGTEWIVVDEWPGDFDERNGEYYSQGLRLKYFNVGLNLDEVGTNRYCALWQPGSGDQYSHAGMSWDPEGISTNSIQFYNSKYFKAGLRLKDVNVGNRQGWYSNDPFLTTDMGIGVGVEDVHFSATWEQGTGPQHWAVGFYTYDKFKALDDLHRNTHGVYLSILKVYDWGTNLP